MYSIGDKVVCDFDGWKNSRGIKNAYLPKKGEVLTVMDTDDYDGVQVLNFTVCPHTTYAAKHFRPFYDATVTRILKQVGGYPKNIR